MVEKFLVKLITSQGAPTHEMHINYVGADLTGYTHTIWMAHRFDSYALAQSYIQANIEPGMLFQIEKVFAW